MTSQPEEKIPVLHSEAPWIDAMKRAAILEARRIVTARLQAERFTPYQNDPIGFGERVLGDKYTEGIRQVMLSVRDNPVTIARSGNAVGKSHCAARIAAWFFSVFQDSKVYMTAAPPVDNLRRVLWGELDKLYETHPDVFMGVKRNVLFMTRGPESFMLGVAIPTSGTDKDREAKFSGKHAPHILFIVDEGDAVPDEIYDGIESCMSGGYARLLILFNPRSAQGPIYEKERDGEANVVHLSAFDHPNVLTGENVIPGAVTRDVTVRRINEWTHALPLGERPTENCFEVPQFLVGVSAPGQDGVNYPPLQPGWRRVEENSFWYMVMGVYPPQGETQLISSAWVNTARKRWDEYVALHGEVPPAGEEPLGGLDIAEMGGDNNSLCFRYGGFVKRFQTWQSVDPDRAAERAVDFCEREGCLQVFVDGIGVGASVAPRVSRLAKDKRLRAFSVKVSEKPTTSIEIGEFYQLRDQLWWSLREWLRTDPQAMLPPDPYLLEELKCPTYEPIESGKIKVMSKNTLRDRLRRSPDRADALCLTFAPFKRPTVLTLGGNS